MRLVENGHLFLALPPLYRLTQGDVMRNVVAAFNSSIQFNKKNFWIDPIGGNQYFVGVQYHEEDIQSIDTVLAVVHLLATTGKQLAADFEAGVLYWCDREGMQVLSCNLDGSELRPLVVPAVGETSRLQYAARRH